MGIIKYDIFIKGYLFMKKVLLALLSLAICMTVGCGSTQSESEDKATSSIDGTWETVSNGWEYYGETQPQYYVRFTDEEISYGHMKAGEFVLDYSDKINSIETDGEDSYTVQATSSNGTQYTFKSSEEDAGILEYYGTWDSEAFGDTYSGSASLVRSSVE